MIKIDLRWTCSYLLVKEIVERILGRIMQNMNIASKLRRVSFHQRVEVELKSFLEVNAGNYFQPESRQISQLVITKRLLKTVNYNATTRHTLILLLPAES